MNIKRIFAFLTVLGCLLGLGAPVLAAEAEAGVVYCFRQEDFPEENLTGICITGLPGRELGLVCLGERVLRPGDVLSVSALAELTFSPARRESDAAAQVTYLPIFPQGVGPEAAVTISIRGRENPAPAAEDFAAETYKNLPLEGKLKVSDPEGEAMTYAIARQPKRGQVELRADGSFLYTPKKNKVGIDSFVYTATDESGKVSREATVTITIVKPTDSTQYTDTLGRDCRFAAEWMKNTGIFVGEKLDGNACFLPEQTVSRGEFLTMLVRTLDIPTEKSDMTFGEEVPTRLQPYLAAAMRAGITAGTPQEDYDAAITGAEAATMIQNALDMDAVAAFSLGEEVLTRGDAALILYQTARLAPEAPGMTVIRKQG
jgi:hypothetical protein